jgi:hypothetical protein
VPLPHVKAPSSPSDSADAILHRAMANVVKEATLQQSRGRVVATQAMKHAVAAAKVPFPSSPAAAATAILNAALSNAEQTVSKTSLAVPFAPLKVISSPALLQSSPAAVFKTIYKLPLSIAGAA